MSAIQRKPRSKEEEKMMKRKSPHGSNVEPAEKPVKGQSEEQVFK
mgnify:CR=1 FL=1